MLGHTQEGQPYRLYMDTSDSTLGCALHQVQAIQIKDLKGTQLYVRLQKAFNNKEKVPRLVMKLSDSKDDSNHFTEQAENFEATTVWIERVIGYYSCRFKEAETRYATMEREVLAAKEGLVCFQPFIKGEDILLVTDHSVLQ